MQQKSEDKAFLKNTEIIVFIARIVKLESCKRMIIL